MDIMKEYEELKNRLFGSKLNEELDEVITDSEFLYDIFEAQLTLTINKIIEFAFKHKKNIINGILLDEDIKNYLLTEKNCVDRTKIAMINVDYCQKILTNI